MCNNQGGGTSPKNNGFVKSILKNRKFPALMQIIGLVLFLGLSVFGFWGATEAYRYTNITSFLVWCVWWPVLMIVVFLSSRLWCSICPLRYINQKLGHLGLQLQVPKVIRKHSILILVGFFLLHTVIVSYGVNHFSWMTSVYLLSLLGSAVIIALTFKKNSFCNSFCPLNGFLGAYSKIGTVALTTSNKDTCKSCQSKECYHNCPSNLCMGAAPALETCVMCFDCVKECPNDNIHLNLRSPVKGLLEKAGTFTGLLVVIILLGILLGEFGEEWPVFEHLVTLVPATLIEFGVPETLFGYHWLEALWLNFTVPLFFVLCTAAVTCTLTGGKSIIETAKKYAPAMIPLLFSMHLSKMVDTMNSKLGYFQFIIKDPLGAETVEKLASGAANLPENIFLSGVGEGLMILAIIAIGLAVSMVTTYRLTKIDSHQGIRTKGKVPFYLTPVITGTTALLIVFNWFNLFGV